MPTTQEPETVSLEEFQRRITEQKSHIPSSEHIAFRCPMCGTVQSAHDLIQAGAGENMDAVEKYLAFSCVGRWTHGKPPPRVKGTQAGCNWTLGGLIPISDLIIVTPDGKRHPRFAPVSPEEAGAHMRRHEKAPVPELAAA